LPNALKRALIILLAAFGIGGCATYRHAQESPIAAPLSVPPLPNQLSQTLLEFYPDASKRAREQGRVVVHLQIDPSGAIDLPIQIDRERTNATPRLEEAAQKILSRTKFETGDNYKKNLTVSIVFELVPCGTVIHDPAPDYRINLCLDPSLYATVNFAEHPPSEFEEQIHKILIHGDLADADFLEETLGVRFRVTRLAPSPYSFGKDHDLHVLLTPIWVPKTIRVTGLSYGLLSDLNGHSSAFRFEFMPVECPDIAFWAARWKIPSASGTDPHGYGSGTDIQWGGDHGIRVSALYWHGGGCQMSLSQSKESGEPFSSHTDSDLIAATPIVRGIGAMIASGDIRNVVRAERALHARFTTSGPGGFGVNYELQDIIPGIDPISFEYSVNDTGKEPSPFGAFSYVPPIPANRSARLRLIVDVYHLCVRREQLPAELHRRGIRFRRSSSDGDDIYVMQGQNEIRMQLRLFGGCVRDIGISQITDVKHALRSSTPQS
jgi:TonB family protein